MTKIFVGDANSSTGVNSAPDHIYVSWVADGRLTSRGQAHVANALASGIPVTAVVEPGADVLRCLRLVPSGASIGVVSGDTKARRRLINEASREGLRVEDLGDVLDLTDAPDTEDSPTNEGD